MAIKAPKIPCGSCPYRRNVPSGVWDASEYSKLPSYDGPTWAQNFAVFMCHQKDGCLCGGWLACHDPQELLALRLHRDIDESVFSWSTDVPVFSSGAEAAAHGMKGIASPNTKAQKIIRGLIRKKERAGWIDSK